MRIGIYGGSFNPPHLGHFHGAQFAVERLQLDKLFLIPAGIAPHKALPAGSPTAMQRLEIMKRAAAEIGDPRITVSDMEVIREGKSYTYETVRTLESQYPGDSLYLIMGTDMFLSFENWKEPDDIAARATLAVLYRGERDEEQLLSQKKETLEKKGYRIQLLQNPVTAISSTDLRRMLAFRCADKYLLPGTLNYILEEKLYGSGRDYHHLTMEEMEEVVVSLLKPSRVAHVLGCRDTAIELGERFGEDPDLCARAGILHDITKALDYGQQKALCRAYGISPEAYKDHYASTIHAFTGGLVAERIFGECPKVVDAIYYHTTGRAGMTKLEKIIYVADYIEPNRDFPGVEELRQTALRDLDDGVALGLKITLEHLKEQGKVISPLSQAALEAFQLI